MGPVGLLEKVFDRKRPRCVLGRQGEGGLIEGLVLLEGLAAHGQLSAGVGEGGRTWSWEGIGAGGVV